MADARVCPHFLKLNIISTIGIFCPSKQNKINIKGLLVLFFRTDHSGVRMSKMSKGGLAGIYLNPLQLLLRQGSQVRGVQFV